MSALGPHLRFDLIARQDLIAELERTSRRVPLTLPRL